MAIQLRDLEDNEIRDMAVECLTKLLMKQPMNAVSRLLRTSNTSLVRWIDPDKPLESIGVMTASYIVLFCETDELVQQVLDSNPKSNAYYSRH